MSSQRCPECNHLSDETTKPHNRHVSTCSLITPDEMRAMTAYYIKAYQKEFELRQADWIKIRNHARHARSLEATARKLIDYYDDPENTPGA